MTIAPTPGPGDFDLRRLATCDATELRYVIDCVQMWSNRESSRKTAAVVTAMASNPHLTFPEFTRVLKYALDNWLTWHDIPGEKVSEAEFQIPASTLGDRAAGWWLRLALQPWLVAAPESSPLGRRHRAWLMRRAFATSGPQEWPALWRSMLGWQCREVRQEFLALALCRGLPKERPTVMDLSEKEIEGLTEAWSRRADQRRRGVPAAATPEAAKAELASVIGHLDAIRAAVAAPLRRAVLHSAAAGEIRGDYGAPLWMALLDEADQAELLARPDACRKEPVSTWLAGFKWGSDPAEAYLTALRIFPLEEASARRHLTCKAPRHRLAMLLNPTCPQGVAVEALRRGIAETAALITSGRIDGGEGSTLIETWWDMLMTARGWLPAEEISAALQEVTGWMLNVTPRLSWFWPLAVAASQADGLVGMLPEQHAAYESWLDELSDHDWTVTDRRYLTGWGARAFGPATSSQMLRRLVHATGGEKSPLLSQGGVAAGLAELRVDLRVQAARRGDHEVLRALVADPDKRVRQHVARNRCATGETLAMLVADHDPTVRAQLARNSAITAECLTTLAADPVARVAQAAGQALLRKFSQVA